jgi:hypothetical protein
LGVHDDNRGLRLTLPCAMNLETSVDMLAAVSPLRQKSCGAGFCRHSIEIRRVREGEERRREEEEAQKQEGSLHVKPAAIIDRRAAALAAGCFVQVPRASRKKEQTASNGFTPLA